MKLTGLRIRDFAPIELFEASDLSNTVVIAGPNGVGKTRLLSAILNLFRNPNPNDTGYITLLPTSDEERTAWGNKAVRTDNEDEAILIRTVLHSNRRRIKWTSSVINIESDRSLTAVQPFPFTWEIANPDEEQLGWDTMLNPLKNRWTDTQHAIFKKMFSLRSQLGSRAMNLGLQGRDSMNLKFKDPIKPFREAFEALLFPKKFIDPDLQNQTLRYEYKGNVLDISTLSSGEKEVLNIVFDIVLRSPSNCIFVIDEPELHLHPELSQKMLRVLGSIGENNQFIYFTHSPEIISSSIEDTVLFMRPPNSGKNQAVRAGTDDDSVQALRMLGQSIGVISLGRKIVLVEGEKASTDKKLYSSIVSAKYPEMVILPVGSVSSISAFDKIRDKILENAIWGVDFFMLCDHDAPYANDVVSDDDKYPRLKRLLRYHIENYFLEADIWSRVFAAFETEDEWLLDRQQVDAEIKKIALDHVSYATALIVSRQIWGEVGKVHMVPSGCNKLEVDELVQIMRSQAENELSRVAKYIDPDGLEVLTREVFQKIQTSFDGEGWKTSIPGRPILQTFLGKAKINDAHVKSSYIKEAMNSATNPFQDILDAFEAFDRL